jgi:hypothetical protein
MSEQDGHKLAGTPAPAASRARASSAGLLPFLGVREFAGAVAGAPAVISLGIRREERASSSASDSPGRVVRGARRLNGLGTCGPGLTRQTGHQ